jgi:putative FmdB family regulatory protein
MPTYEYRCPEGHEFERFYRKISDAGADVECPTCGKPATRVLSGGAGLLFKGSGFYLTDYGKNAHRKGPAAAGKSESKGGDASESAKPESTAKSETSSSTSAESGTSKSERAGEPASDSKKGGAKPPPTGKPTSDP